MIDFNRIYEASINGTYRYEDGSKSGRALATDEFNGVIDITPNSEGQGKAEIDKTGVYLGIPANGGKDTAWVNPVRAEEISSKYGAKARVYQNAYRHATPAEKKSLEDWSPESPDLKIIPEPLSVKDTVNNKNLPIDEKDETTRPESLLDKFLYYMKHKA